MSRKFQLGAVLPTTEVGTNPTVIKDYAQALEDMGFDHLVAYDHVVGADTTNRPDWNMPYTARSAFYEPLILFSYAAAVTTKLQFMSAVVILPQRQTVLFAKQAAVLDVLAQGRLILGVGLGWNEVEYDAVGEGLKFKKRVSRMEDQIRLLHRLWAEPVITETTAPYNIQEAGINPLPVKKSIPILVGGNVEATIKRAAAIGDGWLPSLPSSVATDKVKECKDAFVAAGRNPDDAIIYNNILLGATVQGLKVRSAEDAAADAIAWKKAGATGVCYSTMDMGHKNPGEHIAFLRKVSELIGSER